MSYQAANRFILHIIKNKFSLLFQLHLFKNFHSILPYSLYLFKNFHLLLDLYCFFFITLHCHLNEMAIALWSKAVPCLAIMSRENKNSAILLNGFSHNQAFTGLLVYAVLCEAWQIIMHSVKHPGWTSRNIWWAGQTALPYKCKRAGANLP